MSRVFVFLTWINCDNGHLEYAYFVEINACNGGSVHAVLRDPSELADLRLIIEPHSEEAP